MTSAQKWIAAAGLLALAVTSFFAPYRYTAHNWLERMAGGRGEQSAGILYASLWSPPNGNRGVVAPEWLTKRTAVGEQLDDLELDAGRLALWWGGIGAVAIVAIIVVAPKRASGRRRAARGLNSASETPEEPPEDVQIVATAAQWSTIRTDPRFIELMRLARVANSLILAYGPLTRSPDDLSPRAHGERFASLFYATALIKEGLKTAQSLAKWYRDTPQYREGFAAIAGSSLLQELQDTLNKVRDKLVFHFDRAAIVAGLASSPTDADLFVLATYPATAGPELGQTYFNTADDIMLWYLFGDAQTDAEYQARLEGFMVGVTELLKQFVIAAHQLVAIGLVQLDCKKRRVSRCGVE